MPRSSIAAATAPPCAGRVGDEDADLLRVGAAGEQVLDLARDRLGLGALVGAAARSAAAGSRKRCSSTTDVAVGVEVAEPGARPRRSARPRSSSA